MGPGATDASNAGTVRTMPRLITVTGASGFALDGPVIDTPSKVGIVLSGATGADIVLRAVGGPRVNSNNETAYFALLSSGGGNHRIRDADIRKAANGGKFVTGVFIGGELGGSPGTTVSGGTAEVWEKFVYAYSSDITVQNTHTLNALKSDVIRLNGSNNRAIGNSGNNIKGGVSAYDGRNIEISGNVFNSVKQIGVYVGQLNPNYRGGFSGTRVNGNQIDADRNAAGRHDGILLDLQGADSQDIEVRDNRVSGFATAAGEGNIRIRTGARFSIRRAMIARNKVADTDFDGIVIDRVFEARVEDNEGRAITGMVLRASARPR